MSLPLYYCVHLICSKPFSSSQFGHKSGWNSLGVCYFIRFFTLVPPIWDNAVGELGQTEGYTCLRKKNIFDAQHRGYKKKSVASLNWIVESNYLSGNVEQEKINSHSGAPWNVANSHVLIVSPGRWENLLRRVHNWLRFTFWNHRRSRRACLLGDEILSRVKCQTLLYHHTAAWKKK